MTRIAIIHNIPISYKHLLFSELARRGLEFEVVFLASGSSDRIEFPELATALYRSRIGHYGSYECLPPWHTVNYVWNSLGEIQPDAVIISGWSDVGAWTAKVWCIFHRRPHILWSESNKFDHARSYWKELIKANFLKGFKAAQVYGTTNAEYLRDLGFDSDRIWAKRAVADTELFYLIERVEPVDESRKDILFVGRLAPEKNLEFVLESAKQLSSKAREALMLRIVGYGPLEASLRQKAESLGLSDMVEFAGSYKHSQLPEAYHSADVLLLPSTSEPWGLTVNEGMLCGLPAIVSERCGCARDLVNSLTGWSFSPVDADCLVRIFEQIAAMPKSDLRTMGEHAAAVARGYNAQNCAQIVLECISASISGQAR